MEDKPKFRVNMRHEARKLAVQTLYAWQLSGNSMESIKEDLFDSEPSIFDKPKVFDTEYFNEITQLVTYHAQQLDALLQNCLDRDISQLNPVEHAILRIGAFELKYRTEIPYRVVLNEAILLAKQFGAVESHKYINGVLDKLTRNMRLQEQRSLSVTPHKTNQVAAG
ncbi:transcription antitermination factor NusB [Candidatus Berkiella cookevillensis]|uniref:Transcription antitermination protein NusB n=1 Tax=Candidatus Berkiella cookevillensis TaxID=437022 RepID=A0A0Q9YSR4_9GAMM|nr:transcription antitermination factor NusB [Candidatus Berkiella cookevillensis]MCS5709346.1 transcription antitermination factor NusB [Candidatus Berkiella cookevillensis]